MKLRIVLALVLGASIEHFACGEEIDASDVSISAEDRRRLQEIERKFYDDEGRGMNMVSFSKKKCCFLFYCHSHTKVPSPRNSKCENQQKH